MVAVCIDDDDGDLSSSDVVVVLAVEITEGVCNMVTARRDAINR